MTAAVDEVDRFRDAIARRLGLHFDGEKQGFLGEVLDRRADDAGVTTAAFVLQLELGPTRDQIAALARELTVGETYFFRNLNQFRAVGELCLPDRIRAKGSRRTLRLLSAGCASGEEAYTLAILARGQVDPSWELSILGVDLNPQVIERARAARFTAWSLRETPAEIQQRWFRTTDRIAALDPTVQNMVRFEEANLTLEDATLWAPATYDIVLCRNVIMYLTPAAQRGVIERIERALVPGGYLFLGHAETLRGLSSGFHLRHTHDTFYYQRRADGADRPVEPLAPEPPNMAGDVAWVENIRRASERIHELTAARPAAPAPAADRGPHAHPPPSPPRRSTGMGGVIDLVRTERFADALQLIQTMPSGADDGDALLLRAVLQTHAGDLVSAEATCRDLLARDELDAGAHYVLALCREGTADPDGAEQHDQVAVYLDPGFAMPRLHLGLLARRRGDHAAARRELGEALDLLHREDASRLLMFGGGFGRDALIALCRAEIAACGGAP